MPTTPMNGFELWKQGVDRAPGDSRWSRHDCAVLTTLAAFQLHLQQTPGWQPIDPAWIKAMLWVETGAGSREWYRKPLQIGVPGDAGLGALLSGMEGGDEVLPPGLKARLSKAAVLTIPETNIVAGIGYLLMRLATYEHQSIPVPGSHVVPHTIRPGENLERIARTAGSTADWLKRLNPSAGILRPGDRLLVQRASLQRVVTGWRLITRAFLQDRYNGQGDLTYARKVAYALQIVRKVGIDICPR